MSRLAAVLAKKKAPVAPKGASAGKKRKLSKEKGVSNADNEQPPSKKAAFDTPPAASDGEDDEGLQDVSGAYDELIGLLSKPIKSLSVGARRSKHQRGRESGESDEHQVRVLRAAAAAPCQLPCSLPHACCTLHLSNASACAQPSSCACGALQTSRGVLQPSQLPNEHVRPALGLCPPPPHSGLMICVSSCMFTSSGLQPPAYTPPPASPKPHCQPALGG